MSFINGEIIGKEYEKIGPWGIKFKTLISKDEGVFEIKRKDIKLNERIEAIKKAAKIMEKEKEKIIRTISIETGKCYGMAEKELNATIKRMLLVDEEKEILKTEFIDSREIDGRIAFVEKEPIGDVLVISPFNYPLGITVLMAVPIILGGNKVIIKPSLKTPNSAFYFVDALIKGGIPKENIHLLITNHENIKIDKVDGIAFTGSSEVGLKLIEKYSNKKIIAELGGKGNALVLDDANLNLSAKEISIGAFSFSGQRCDAIARVLVTKKNKKELINKIEEEIKKMKFCNINDENGLTPLIDKNAIEKYKELIEDATNKGAKLIGNIEIKENFVTPVILENVNEKMKIFWEEAFSPILSVIEIEEEKMVEIANKNKYALDSSIFTNNLKKAYEIAKKLDDGSISINRHPKHGVSYIPYGGYKNSGMGRIGIKKTALFFTKEKYIIY